MAANDDSNNSNGSNGAGKSPKKFHGKKRVAQLTQAADVLQGLLQNSKSHLSDGFIRWRLEQQWTEIVGATIGEQTLPCAFEKGTLFIWVKHPAWAQQLRFFQDSIKDKVNAHLGREPGKEWARYIKFTLSRRSATTELKNSSD
jgi:hypothetical protein